MKSYGFIRNLSAILGGRAALTGIAVIIVLLAFGAYWLLSSHSKKVVEPPLMVNGVGLYLTRNRKSHKFEVKKIFPDSPAEKAGLVPGLILNKVNDVLVEQKNVKELSLLLMGPVGTKVQVETIDRSGATNRVEILREQFVNHSTQ